MRYLPHRMIVSREPNSAETPLLLLHGFTGSGAVWDDVIAHLSVNYPCITVELPGHGMTNGAQAESIGFQSTCSSIVATLDELNVLTAHVWGYSMGGRIALHLALDHPERLDHLILESASPGIVDRVERMARLQADEELAVTLESDGLEPFVKRWMDRPLFASQKSVSTARQERARELRLRNSAAGLAAALRGFSVGRQEPLHGRLNELPMPTLVITGESDQKYRAIAASMAHSIQCCQLRIIAGAGHAPHWERPQQTADAVREFLSRDTD